MIRTLAVNCALIVVYSNDDGKTTVESATDRSVNRTLNALFEYSPLVNQHIYSKLFFKVVANTVKKFVENTVLFENRTCQTLPIPMWMNCWQENAICYKNKRFIISKLQ